MSCSLSSKGQSGASLGPAEVSPDVFDAIAVAVDSGIIVVEPAGNGAVDLDDPVWEGWFGLQRSRIQEQSWWVAEPPLVLIKLRALGSLVALLMAAGLDLQGWYTSIVTTGGAELSDAFFPESDPRQAYTANLVGPAEPAR